MLNRPCDEYRPMPPVDSANGNSGAALAPPQPRDRQYSRHLARELRRFTRAQPHRVEPRWPSSHTTPQVHPRSASPESLKRDLLDIHRRHSKKPPRRHHRESLTQDLLEIHRRNSLQHSKPKHKGRRSSKKVHPIQAPEELRLNALIDILDAHQDNGGYTKDYVRLSNEYKRMEKYRVPPAGATRETKHSPPCVACSRRCGQKALFPCEHKCLCSACLDKKTPIRQCPLCRQAVRFVGKGHEEYWRWIEEVKPSISASFVQTFFVRSKDAIGAAMMPGVDGYQESSLPISEDDGGADGQEPPEYTGSRSWLCCWGFCRRRRARDH